MPVVFAQPEPFAPNLVAAYGASQQQRQDLPLLADAYARQAAARAQQQAQRQQGDGGRGASQAADLMARGNEGNYDRIQQSLLADARRQAEEQQLALHARQIAQQGMYTNRDAFRDEAEAQTRAGLVQLQSYMQSQELTYAEELRMKRLQDGLSYVNSIHTLDPETRAAIASQMLFELSPYQIRQQKAMAAQAEQHAALFEQQAIKHKEVAMKQANLETMAFPQRFRHEPQPDGTVASYFLKQIDANGDMVWEHVKPEKPERPRPEDFVKMEKEIHDTARAMVEAQVRPSGEGKDGQPVFTLADEQKKAQLFREITMQLRGGSDVPLTLQGRQPGQGAQAFDRQPEPRGYGGGDKAPPRLPDELAARVVAEWENSARDIQALDIPPDQKAILGSQVKMVVDLLRPVGGNLALLRPEQQEFVKMVAARTKAAQQPRAAPAAAGAARGSRSSS